MADVHVVFPRDGGVAIHDDVKPVIKGHFVHWHVHSMNERVASVKIEFADNDATYFPVGSAFQSHFEKPLAKGPTIWGQVPKYKPNGRRRDKYTVTGLDSTGGVVARLDPIIIPDDP